MDLTLAAGDAVTVTSGSEAEEGPGFLRWTRRNVWNNSGDPGQLFDEDGHLIAETGTQRRVSPPSANDSSVASLTATSVRLAALRDAIAELELETTLARLRAEVAQLEGRRAPATSRAPRLSAERRVCA